MAIRTGAEIVPVAIEEYDKSYYINIGQNISLAGYTLDQKGQATEELRDILCTLKWKIWEKHGKALRADIPDGYERTFIEGFEKQTDDVYTLEDIQNTRYHPKVTDPEEAFAFMQRLNPSRENAFLFQRKG